MWKLLMLCILFLMNIFFITPVVQSIWVMLVMPYYYIQLETGVVLFILTISSLIKYKYTKSEECSTTFEDLQKSLSYWSTVCMFWLFAKGYTYFL